MAVYKVKKHLYTRLHTREKEGDVHNMSKSENEDKQYSDMTKEELAVGSPDYVELIIQMVHKIDKQEYLVNIYYFVKVMYDKCKKCKK